jgi:tetratricopeptide (TPR) repeat protein
MWAFQDALELRPEDAEARRGLARALIVARLPRRALETLAETSAPRGSAGAAASMGGAEELENRRVAAAAYLTMGDPLGAVTMLEVGGSALNSSPAALLDLANAYEALGDDDAAVNAYRRLLQIEPHSVEGLIGLSRAASRQKRWTEALQAAVQARLQLPSAPQPVYQLARVMMARWDAQTAGNRSAAIRPLRQRPGAGSASPEFLQALNSLGGYGPAQLQIGLWDLQMGQAAAAIGSLEHAVAARAGGDEARLRLAEALAAAGRKADAAYQRGRYYDSAQQMPEAIREYQRLAVLDPSRKEAPLLLSALYNRMEKNEPALDAAENGFRRFPNDLSIRARLGLLLLLSDQRPRAADLCRHWMQELPKWGEPYRLLARMEREAIHVPEAAKLAARAMELDPRNAEYCLEAAQAYSASLQPDQQRRAVAALRQGLALDPGNPEIHLRLGEALERLGDLDGARLHYLRSMDGERNVRFGVYSLSQLCPRLEKAARTRFYAANTRALRERDDTVTELWRRVYQNPADVDAHAKLADLLLSAGDLQPAIHQLEQTIRLHPSAGKQRQLEILRRLQEMREG